MSEQITEQEWEQIADRAYSLNEENLRISGKGGDNIRQWGALFESEKTMVLSQVKATAQALKEWAEKTKSPDTEIKELTEAQILEVWDEIANSHTNNPNRELNTWEDETKSTKVSPIFAKVINTIRARYPVTAGVDHSKETEQAVEAAQPAEVKAEVKPIDMAVLRVMVENAWNKEHNRVRGLTSPCLAENYQMPGRSYRSVIHDNFWSELQEQGRSLELTWAKALLEEATESGYLFKSPGECSEQSIPQVKQLNASDSGLLLSCVSPENKQYFLNLLKQLGIEVPDAVRALLRRTLRKEKAKDLLVKNCQLTSETANRILGELEEILDTEH